MLRGLFVKNFLLIDELSLNFEDKKLYVITGETGAGKSILLDCLLFLLSSRINTNVIRPGSESAIVIGEFTIDSSTKDYLTEHGYEVEDNLIILKKMVDINNKKKCFLNNQFVTQSFLNDLADLLLDYNGQNTHNAFYKESAQIDFLDQFADLYSERKKIEKLYTKLTQLKGEKEMLSLQHEFLLKEWDYLSHVAKEIENLNVKEHEEEELTLIYNELQNFEKKYKLLKESLALIEGYDIDGNILNLQKLLTKISVEDFSQQITDLDNVITIIRDTERKLNEYIYSKQNNQDIEYIASRLFQIRDIARKYNIASRELGSYLEKVKQKASEIKSRLNNYNSIEDNIKIIEDDYIKSANYLSQERKKAILMLEEQMKHELESLKMGQARFQIEINSSNYSSKGIDNVSFKVSMNPGMPFVSVSKTASGGELARLMLGFKVAFYNKTYKPIVIFDEIDTGIGGATADAIGNKLKKLSDKMQIFVITHQPQVASKSNLHIKVEKFYENNHSHTRVKLLSEEERRAEIARMISGEKITEESLNAAKSLINASN